MWFVRRYIDDLIFSSYKVFLHLRDIYIGGHRALLWGLVLPQSMHIFSWGNLSPFKSYFYISYVWFVRRYIDDLFFLWQGTVFYDNLLRPFYCIFSIVLM